MIGKGKDIDVYYIYLICHPQVANFLLVSAKKQKKYGISRIVWSTLSLDIWVFKLISMEIIENNKIKQDFIKGKHLLDQGKHEASIKIFDALIEISINELDSYEDNVTLHTSLNNRGIAKCKLGASTNDKSLYISGMNDLKKAVVLFGLSESYLKPQASQNLERAESVIELWEKTYQEPEIQLMFQTM